MNQILKGSASETQIGAFLASLSMKGETIDEVIALLNDPDNYIHYEEIVTILKESGIYDNYKVKLRMAAYNAMKNDFAPYGIVNE